MTGPDQSRRPSVMLQREEENKVGNGVVQAIPPLNKEEKFRADREKASTRIE